MTLDLRLYALLDPAVSGGRTLDELAADVAGSVTLVQLRDKKSETRALVEQARALMAVLRPKGLPLLINDRVDVALAAKADGVHIGQQDMSPQDARALLGPKAIIGLSLRTLHHVRSAPLDILDYVDVGGIFGTTSKDSVAEPIGLAGLRELVRAIRARKAGCPICAIAGIDRSNAGAVVAAGVDGVAVISALSLAADPAQAARELRGIVDTALGERAAS